MPESTMQRLCVRDSDINGSIRGKIPGIAPYDRSGVVHMLKNEAHADSIKALIGIEILEISMGNINAGSWEALPEAIYHFLGPFNHYIALKSFCEKFGGITMPQAQFQDTSRSRQRHDPFR